MSEKIIGATVGTPLNPEKMGEEYVKKTDYATRESAGVVKSDDRYGTRMVNGILDICAANKNVIDNRSPVENPLYGVSSNNRHPIVAANVDYAVKSVLSGAKIEMTAEEQAAALAWLGLGDLVARLEALEAKVYPPLITFSFKPTSSSPTYELQAEEGMTWGEFIDSEYNIEVEGYKMGKASWGEYIAYLGNNTQLMSMETGDTEPIDNIIVAGKLYYSFI